MIYSFLEPKSKQTLNSVGVSKQIGLEHFVFSAAFDGPRGYRRLGGEFAGEPTTGKSIRFVLACVRAAAGGRL